MSPDFFSAGKSYLLSIFFVFVFTWIPQSQALPLSVARLTLEQGLSQSTVYAIAQDQSGYIWFGTADGVDIYDGYRFRHLRQGPSGSASLSDNYVRSLLIDRKGIVWIGTLGGGLNRYDPVSQEWTHYRASSDRVHGLLSDDVYSIYESADGDIWTGSEAGVSRLDPARGIFHHYPSSVPETSDGVTSGIIRAITQTGDGDLWFGSASSGLSRFDPETETFTRYRHDSSDSHSLSNNSINAIYEDSQQRLWIGTEYGGLNRFDRQSGQFIRFVQNKENSDGLNDSEVTSVIEDRDGWLWLGTWSGGLNRFDPDSGRFLHYRSSKASTSSLSSDTVISLFEDRSGVLWAGTYDNGANRIAYQGVDFPHYRYDPLQKEGLRSRMVWAFAEDLQGDIWIGSKKGLSRLAPAEGTVPAAVSNAQCNGALESADIRSIVVDSPWLWLGTAGGGLLKLNPETCDTRHFRSRQNDPNTLSNNHARLLLRDDEGFLWIGTKQGLNRLDPETGDIDRFPVDALNPAALPHARIRALYQDSQGVLWVGTSGGLSRYDKEQKRFFTLTAEQGALSGNDVRSVYRDSAGVLWIATGSGLTRYDLRDNEARFFYEKDGLSNNTLYGIMPDGKYLWITTNNGLSKFDTESFTVRTYDGSDGLQSNEFNFNAYLKTRNDAFLVGGVNGFNYFRPKQFGSLKTLPELQISGSVYNEDGLSGPLTKKDPENPLVLKQSDRKIVFHISVLHYLNPEKNSYRYRLKGYEDHWKLSRATDQAITFAGLPQGEYSLEVEALAGNGMKSSEISTWHFRVQPSPWQSVWAWMGYMAALATFFWGMLRLRTAAYRRRERKLQNLIESNTAELHLRNQQLDEQARELERMMDAQDAFYLRTAHELRTPLSLIRAPAEILSNGQSCNGSERHTGIILQGTERLQRLIDQMLAAAVNKAIHEPGTQTFDLRSFVKPLIEAHRGRAEQRGVSVLESPIPDAAVTLNRSALEDILHNLIDNAVKYTPDGGKVSVEVMPERDQLRVSVTDTGIGIEPGEQQKVFERQYRGHQASSRTPEGEGVGLYTVSQAASSCGGEICLESEPGRGSCFRVWLPCLSTGGAAVTSDACGYQLPATAQTCTDDQSSETAGTETLLIIEDDPSLQQVLDLLLRPQYKLIFTASAEQGMQAARTQLPALILCDVMLPDGCGFDVTRTLKNDDTTSHIPIIHLTALGDPENKITGLRCSADDYIVKPFSAEELKLRIATQIQNRIRQREWCRRRFLFSAEPDTTEDNPGISSADLSFIESLEEQVSVLLRKRQCNLDSVAQAMHQSGRTVQRKIKNILGCSYTEYVQSQQLKMSRELLESGLSVKESAYLSGFSDPTHLNRLFKSQYGTTPGQHRRATAKTVQSRQKAVES